MCCDRVVQISVKNDMASSVGPAAHIDCHANGGADLPLFAVRYGACGRRGAHWIAGQPERPGAGDAEDLSACGGTAAGYYGGGSGGGDLFPDQAAGFRGGAEAKVQPD